MRSSQVSLSPFRHTPQSQKPPLSCPRGYLPQGELSSPWGMLWSWLCPRQDSPKPQDTGGQGRPPEALWPYHCECMVLELR